MPLTMTGSREPVKPSTLHWALALACILLWAAKLWLIPRLNINWDEFFFLTNVHAAARGELTQGLQTAYTHLFWWLPKMVGDEISQVHAGRGVMVLLLGISALLIQRLAARWFSPVAAWTAALAFLAMWPTLKHGGSFRADSLLLPLQLAALVALTRPQLSDRDGGLITGVLLGIATAISIKAVLLAPVVVALGMAHPRDWRRGLRCLSWLIVAALPTAAVLLSLHFVVVTGQGAGTAGAAAQGAWQKTVHNAPWLPQYWTLRAMLQVDMLFWLTASAGLAWAIWRKMWAVAAFALAFLPILFYRNSFAYYYVVMWGPACVLIAAASDATQELSSRVARPLLAGLATLSLAALLGAHGLRQLPFLSTPRQIEQRELVTVVHTIFPEPVAYIDHSGMMASFRKVNMFMSTWGVEGYLTRGAPFMRPAMEKFRPPLLIANRAELIPGTGSFSRLLPEDQQVILTHYIPYWGPVRVAGAVAIIAGHEPTVVQLPFGGRYRLESTQPVVVDGKVREPGAVIPVDERDLALGIAVHPDLDPDAVLQIRLVWADARRPPAYPPKSFRYYDGL